MTENNDANMNMTDDDSTLYAELLNDCPEYTDAQEKFQNDFSFWVEGISQTSIAILGIIGNILASIILSRKEMRNAFNLLLVTMAIFDSTYLFGSILESFRKQFNLATDLHLMLFPHLLYPFNQMAITASIFMTVAIALERFIAVHYPLNYSQAMHEANALTKRIVKYVACVTLLSVVFTFTRFFEAQVIYQTTTDEVTNDNRTELLLVPTSFRIAPLYIVYFNWSRLIVLGIIPFAMLVFFNLKIYQDIKARRNRRLKPISSRHPQQKKEYFHTALLRYCACCCCCAKSKAKSGEEVSSPSTPPEETHGLVETTTNGTTTLSVASVTQAKLRPTTKPAPPVTVNESRRKKEDNLAGIFMGFIMVFLVCHLPRLLLNIHELATLEHAMQCQEQGQKAFPLWSLFMICLSHLLLNINSATNMFIYCCLSSKFREECRKVFRKF